MKTMKYSIKRQLALIFIGLMAGTILLCWFINNSLLQKYYEKNREKAILETYKIINEAAKSETIGDESFQIELQKISARYNIMGVIQDMNGVIVGTFGNDMDMLQGLLWDRLYLPIIGQKITLQSDNYTIQKVMDVKTKTEYLEMIGSLSEGQVFYMRTPLDNIKESVNIANRFLLYIGLISIVISSIIIWLVSKKIAEPILELANISERMAKLDFDAKYNGKSKNEIAILGSNINTLSETLEETIKELKNANIELQKDIEKKNQIDEMRKEFLSNVSHELKTPIALIQGYAEGLQEGISDDSESRAFYCDVITDEAKKMNHMVKKLLTLNELEFGNDSVTMERFDIVSFICNYLHSVEIITKQNNISVRMEHYDPIFVWADEFMVEEVFENFFSNAINHCTAEKIIDVKLKKIDNVIRISVFNTGLNIPDESISHIWDKFYKVDKARSREYGGSGVGLSIVKAIMNALKHEYGVINYDNGVAFFFELDMVGKD